MNCCPRFLQVNINSTCSYSHTRCLGGSNIPGVIRLGLSSAFVNLRNDPAYEGSEYVHRIHVIDAELSSGVTCTFKGKYKRGSPIPIDIPAQSCTIGGKLTISSNLQSRIVIFIIGMTCAAPSSRTNVARNINMTAAMV